MSISAILSFGHLLFWWAIGYELIVVYSNAIAILGLQDLSNLSIVRYQGEAIFKSSNQG